MLRTQLTMLFILLLAHTVQAQDANYWSSSFGPGGFFSPGSVIANNRDSGVMFYNPALLALAHKRAASISGTIYQMESIKIKNGTGKGRHLSSNNFSSVPQMLSGTFSLKKKSNWFVSYALINNYIINYHTSQRRDARFNVLNDDYSPGDEYYIGQYTDQNTIRETAVLISSAVKLSSRLAAGLSVQGQAYKQHYDFSYTSRALISSGGNTGSLPLASNEALYQVGYTHIGLKLKAGLAYEMNAHHFGLLISSPLMHIRGKGTLVSDNAIANIKDAYGDDINLLANSRQTNLKSRWKAPFSISLGYAYDYGKGQLYFATEYFSRIKEYNIITPRNEYFLRPDTGDNNVLTSALLRLKDAHKSVINFAAGISYALKKDITGYFSFRTDFSYADKSLFVNGSGFTPNTANWDDYHCQLGVNLKRKKYNLRTGIMLTYGGSNSYDQPINFDDPDGGNLLMGNTSGNDARGRHMLASFMLAFIHNL